jgi:23S rRNA pseudouridine1911/1915/1917 synthase
VEKLFEIIYEDAELLVVNKSAGLVCHPTKNGEMSSLIGRARLYLVNVAQPHLINRLDRETSGVVLIAKSSAVAGELGKIFESRGIEKEYLAIVHGHVAAEQGMIDVPLAKDERSIVAVKDCVRVDGANAQTEFFVERKFSNTEGKFSLLRLLPRTGRKHQIRIHLAHIGHPIVGDKLYGHDEDCYLALAQNRLTDTQRAKLIFQNHALHARSLKFNWRGKDVLFSCEPEKSFVEFVATHYTHLHEPEKENSR